MMTYYEDKTEFLRCECHCPEHIMIVNVSDNTLDDKPLPPDFYFDFQVSQWRPFYRRVWAALKYIFGESLSWDNVILHKEDIPKLKAALKHYDSLNKKYAKKMLDKSNS